MTRLGLSMLRAAVALQVAILEREEEDITGPSVAVVAMERIVKEITVTHKLMKKADL